jgi:serine/threonine protein kinase
VNQSHPQPGSVLAERYRLDQVIGEGGMGIVYEAQNTLTEKRVAIKWLHSSIASNPEASKRLVREAKATCRVRHPNVVDVYDVVHEGDAIFLVMELLEGERLEELLKRGGMPLHQLVALLLPAMRGVAEAHRLKVIHRDIHPANIFLARQPNAAPMPKVLDFGISKMGGDDTPSLTRSGTTMGRPLYMSYEQLCSASDVDARTDVYSFGVILYEALTGQPPYEADSFAELAVMIATAEPIPPKQLQPDIPTSLEQVILWAMERDRDDRIDSMDTFIRELEPFAAEHAFRAQMTEVGRSLPLVIPRAERPHGRTPGKPPPAVSGRVPQRTPGRAPSEPPSDPVQTVSGGRLSQRTPARPLSEPPAVQRHTITTLRESSEESPSEARRSSLPAHQGSPSTSALGSMPPPGAESRSRRPTGVLAAILLVGLATLGLAWATRTREPTPSAHKPPQLPAVEPKAQPLDPAPRVVADLAPPAPALPAPPLPAVTAKADSAEALPSGVTQPVWPAPPQAPKHGPRVLPAADKKDIAGRAGPVRRRDF